MPILLIFILINLIGWVDNKSLKITKQKTKINLLFIIKNMKKLICKFIYKITFGKVCYGWCDCNIKQKTK
jgi:hypothetical protein